ncbi:fimbrial protein, partial [Klebsiella pneumoniae]|nr:fimbrial protein [Klebsiella pneumoniae]
YLYTFGDDADIHTFKMVARMFSPYGQVRSGMVGFTATFDVAYK